MASPKVEEYAKGIVQQMKFLNAFPNGDYMDRIFNKVRRIPLFSSTFELQSNGHTVGSDPNSTLLDGIDQKALLTELGVHTVVSSISALDNGTDKGKFRTTIKGVSI